MKKTILKFGLISGLISAALMAATVPLLDKIGFDHGVFFGNTMIVLSMLLVYFGIRSYRDNVGGGQISFARGLAIGISITIISSMFYVVTWEIVYFNFMHDFMDKYAAYLVSKAKATGASPAALQSQLDQIAKTRAMYENPFLNAAITFIEPFPVGLVITLISAAILRKRRPTEPSPSAMPASY